MPFGGDPGSGLSRKSSTLERRVSESDGHAPQHHDAQALGTNEDFKLRALQRFRKKLAHDPELQSAAADESLLKQLRNPDLCCAELFKLTCQLYADRTAFKFSPKGAPQFESMTYMQVWEQTQQLATGLVKEGLLKQGEFVGIQGFASLDWIEADYASTCIGSVMVPVPTNIRADDICKILLEAEASCLVCSAAELAAITPVAGLLTCLRAFVIMDTVSLTPEQLETAKAELKMQLPSGVKVTTMPEVKAAGAKAGGETLHITPKGADDTLIALFYTSGSTGLPKGAMYKEAIWRSMWQTQLEGSFGSEFSQVALNFLPLNHIMGQWSLLAPFARGGVNYFTRKADLSTFFEDLAIARPTICWIIPRISKMLADRFDEGLTRVMAKHKGKLPDSAKQAAVEDFRENQMGGRVFAIATGSAPTAPSLIDTLRSLLLAPIYEGYGSTEFGMGTLDGKIGEGVTKWKLRDVPELGYSTKDRPFPRGELLIATKQLVPGYYKHEKATNETFIDGMMETGDIFEQRGPDMIFWVDRKKNILKLSQGEFVSTSRLEADYAGNSGEIHQIYIYGSSMRSYLLAIIVPSEALRAKYASDPKSKELKTLLRNDVDDLARKKALQGYEIPRDFIVEMEPFSKANHLMTDSGKPSRGKLKERYGATLEELYTTLEDRQRERQAAIREKVASGSAGSVEEQVKQAAVLVLGVDEEDIDASSSFAQLGGDSLAAIQFQRQIEELTGAALPVSFVLDHSQTLAAITAKCEELLAGGADSDVVTFAKIHPNHNPSNEAELIDSSELQLARFIPHLAEVAGGAAAAEQLPKDPTRVLLTGANGFLGRFLLLELLERVADKPDGYVVAVVRGSSDEAALSRLRHGYDSGDAHLLAHFDKLAEGKLRVYHGDLARPNLGLKPEVYKELAGELDTLVHNGALVNHAFSYEQLFEPNVLGTVEVIKLALLKRRKALTFISSVGVAVAAPTHEGPILESEDGTKLAAKCPGGGGYAFGYGCSKWACEVLLRQAADEFGVPVSVFRCGMILASSKYLGQINPTDFFTRLLAGTTYLNIAPESYYQDPKAKDNHFSGMPVDFVADAITSISAANRSRFGLYHVTNPHWTDGVSLDKIADWVQSAGYSVERIPEYQEWFTRFKAGLKALDPKRQQQSPLPIIHQWEQPMASEDIRFDTRQLQAGVREHSRWPDVPHLTEEYTHKNLEHMRTLHLIEAP